MVYNMFSIYFQGGHQVFKVNFKGFQGIFQFSLKGNLANSRDFRVIFKGFSRDLSTERVVHSKLS